MIRYTTMAMILLLSACGTVVPPSPSVQGSVASGAGHNLLAQAEGKVAQGDVRAAIAVLERAVRLQPRHAEAWVRLAELYLQLNEVGKAGQFARRSLQFSPSPAIRARAERVIQQARQASSLG